VLVGLNGHWALAALGAATMRIAAVHQITGKEFWVTNLSGSLSKIATHPKCPLQPHDQRPIS